MEHVLDIVAGPDAGRAVALEPGRHLVGRASSCRIAIDDPSVESHHAVVDVPVAGPPQLVAQLAGRQPIRVDGHPACRAIPIPIPIPMPIGVAIEVGDSLVMVRDRHGEPWPMTPVDSARPAAASGLTAELAAAAESLRRADLARVGAGRVVLGPGTVRLALEPPVFEGCAGPAVRGPAHDVEAMLERFEMHQRHPVLADLGRSEREVIGLVASAADATAGAAREGVVASILAQLAVDPLTTHWPVVRLVGGSRSDSHPAIEASSSERVVIVADRAAVLAEGAVVERLAARGVAVTVLLIAEPTSAAVRRCTAALHLGTRWRGRWIADTADALTVVRLHVRGLRHARPAPRGDAPTGMCLDAERIGRSPLALSVAA